MTKVEVIWDEVGGFMNCCTVGKEGLGKLGIPVVLVILYCFCQDCFNSPVESFYLSIALRMVR